MIEGLIAIEQKPDGKAGQNWPTFETGSSRGTWSDGGPYDPVEASMRSEGLRAMVRARLPSRSVNTKEESNMQVLSIEAPEDVFIKSVAAPGPIKRGSVIVEFRSPLLDRMAASLQAMIDHVTVLERPFKDGRLDQEIKMYHEKESALKDACDQTEKARATIQDEVYLGNGATQLDLAEASALAAQAKASWLEAQISASQAERKRDDLQEQIDIAKRKLTREQQFIRTMIDSLVYWLLQMAQVGLSAAPEVVVRGLTESKSVDRPRVPDMFRACISSVGGERTSRCPGRSSTGRSRTTRLARATSLRCVGRADSHAPRAAIAVVGN